MERKISIATRWFVVSLMIFSGLCFIPAGNTVAASPQDTVIVPAGGPIQIALVTWIDPGIPSQDYYDAFQMAVDNYGPVKGFSIQRNDYDGGCDKPTGEFTGHLISAITQTLGVVGPYCSSSTRGMAPVLDLEGMVMIGYSNTMPDLGGYGWSVFNRVVVNEPFFNNWDLLVRSIPSALDWNAEFHATYGRWPDMFSKYVYDATLLLLTRIDEVSTLDGSNNLLVDRATLATAVRDTSAFMGVTGNITLKPDGDRVNMLTGTISYLPLVKK